MTDQGEIIQTLNEVEDGLIKQLLETMDESEKINYSGLDEIERKATRKKYLKRIVEITCQLLTVPKSPLKDDFVNRLLQRLRVCGVEEAELYARAIYQMVVDKDDYFDEEVVHLIIDILGVLLSYSTENVSILKDALWSLVLIKYWPKDLPEVVHRSEISQHLSNLIKTDNLQIKLAAISASKRLLEGVSETATEVSLFYENLVAISNAEIANMTQLPVLDEPEEHFLYTTHCSEMLIKSDMRALFCEHISDMANNYDASKETFYKRIYFFENFINLFNHVKFGTNEWTVLRDAYLSIHSKRREGRESVEDLYLNVSECLYKKIAQDSSISIGSCPDLWNRRLAF